MITCDDCVNRIKCKNSTEVQEFIKKAMSSQYETVCDDYKKASCKDCSRYKQLKEWTYNNDGSVNHKDIGFCCTLFLDEGVVVKTNNTEICEEFISKEEQ